MQANFELLKEIKKRVMASSACVDSLISVPSDSERFRNLLELSLRQQETACIEMRRLYDMVKKPESRMQKKVDGNIRNPPASSCLFSEKRLSRLLSSAPEKQAMFSTTTIRATRRCRTRLRAGFFLMTTALKCRSDFLQSSGRKAAAISMCCLMMRPEFLQICACRGNWGSAVAL